MSGMAALYDQLQAIILERFAASHDGDPGAAFVAFEFGTPIPDDTFRLKDPNRTLSPELATEFLSHHVDTVPDISDMMFTRSDRSVEKQYEILLLGATASDPAAMELVGGIKRSAAAAFDNTVASMLGPDKFRPVQATPVNWYDVSAASNWIQIKIDQHDTPPTPPAHPRPRIDPRLLQWMVVPETLKETLKYPVKEITHPFALEHAVHPVIIEHAHSHVIEEVARSPLLLERGFQPNLRARPDLRARAAVMDLHRVGVEVPAAAPQRTFSPLLYKRSALNFQALIAGASSPQPVAADQFGLEVSICIVQVRRPWLSDALLSLPSWYVPGFTAGSFSSAPPEHTGNLSIVPTACILIRDLKIKSQWSNADRGVIESSANLGSFNLFGRSFDSNTMTLTIPGMQSLAWLCEPSPVLPPNAPPAS